MASLGGKIYIVTLAILVVIPSVCKAQGPGSTTGLTPGTTTATTGSTPSNSTATTPSNSTATSPANSSATSPANSSATTPANTSATTHPPPGAAGRWERTNLPHQLLCVPGDASTKAACADLGKKLAAEFHKSENLTDVSPGECVYLTEGPPKNNSAVDHKLIRCKITGVYTNAQNAKDSFRLHFFNQNNNHTKEILVIGYWGNASLPSNNTVATPIS